MKGLLPRNRRKPHVRPSPKRLERPMTVCIAAIAGRDRVVCVADKLLTLHTADEFETTISKMWPFGRSLIALYADSGAIAAEIMGPIYDELRERFGEGANMTLRVGEIAEMYAAKYAELWRKRTEVEILGKHGLDHATFNAARTTLRPQLVDDLLDQMRSFDLGGTEAIIVGVDEHGGPDIWQFTDGRITNMRVPGFAAIGSGAEHALAELALRKCNTDMPLGAGLFLLLAAKRRAESVTGVGSATDMFVCGPEPDSRYHVQNVDSGHIARLYDSWREETDEGFQARSDLVIQSFGGVSPKRPFPPGSSAPPPQPDSTRGQ